MAHKITRQQEVYMPSKAEVEAHVQKLANANGGRITPQEILTDAENPDSPIHHCFEWNDKEAAQLHRLNQARSLIRSCRVVFKTDTTKIKSVAYVRDPTRDAKDAGYISVNRVKNNTEISRDVLLQEFSRAAAALARAKRLAQVFGMAEKIDDFLREIEVLRFQAESHDSVLRN